MYEASLIFPFLPFSLFFFPRGRVVVVCVHGGRGWEGGVGREKEERREKRKREKGKRKAKLG